MPTPPAPKNPVSRSIINPDADRRLGRIALTYGAVVFVLLIAVNFGMAFINTRVNLPVLPKSILNGLSMLFILVPFYFGIYKLYQARLEIGRERVEARAWPEAVAALEPFTSPMQRWLDSTGEAHYHLGTAYAALGDKARAEKARAYVRRKQGSPWAEKLTTGKGPSIVRSSAASRAKAYEAAGGEQAARDGQEKRPTPPKTKPRRRF